LLLLVFTAKGVQPYLFAICIELPLQIFLFHKHCRTFGIPACTTTRNAQNSEHMNKAIQEIEKKTSSHQHRTAGDSEDIKTHVDSRGFRPFVCEYVKGTCTAIRLANQRGNNRCWREGMQPNLPDENNCPVCGHAAASDVHANTCGHAWMVDIKKVMEEGKLPAGMETMLCSPEAKKALMFDGVVIDVDQPAAGRTHQVHVGSNQADMRKTRKHIKNSPSKPCRPRA